MDDKVSRILELVAALDECTTLANRPGRDLTVQLLDEPIPTKIPRSDNRNDDLHAIVSTCADHIGGIDSLVNAVDAREKGAVYMPLVRQRADALKRALDRLGTTPIPRATAVARLEPGYALSIGISKYFHADKKHDRPTPNEFPGLGFAANDAKAFHELLRGRGYQGPEPLTDGEATLRGIMHALDELRRQCQDVMDPLVLIFFSGHGARDAEGRHFLVPHDGVRNDLFATALWSRTLESALRMFATKRLVVFLDACHAAGIEGDGEKGFEGCDPKALLEEQTGRYLVASCLANQISREADGHGLFSAQLLQLMRCENEADSKREVVDLYELSVVLKDRVKQAARNEQEPWSNVQQPTLDIVLAINQARLRARRSREDALLEAVNQYYLNHETEGGELIVTDLSEFVTGPFVIQPSKRFERYFRDAALRWKGVPPDPGELEKICRQLAAHYLGPTATPEARETPAAAVRGAPIIRPEAPKVQGARQPAVPGRTAAGPSEDASERLTAKLISAPGLLERRCLPSEDVSYVLENVRMKATKAKYSGRIALLTRLLTRSDGMSEKEFKALQLTTCSDGDTFWAELVDEMGERFESRWPNAFKPGPAACTLEQLDLLSIANRLRQAVRPVDQFIADRLAPETREALAEYQGEGPDRMLAEAVACFFNTLIHGPSIWEDQRFGGIALRAEARLSLSQNLQGENLHRSNRMLLEDAYPEGLRKQSVEGPVSLRRGRGADEQGASGV